MPVHKQGSGYRWGESGKVYTGPGAADKAARQGRAIEASKHAGDAVRSGFRQAAKKAFAKGE